MCGGPRVWCPAPEPDQLRPGGSGIRACGAATEQTFWNEIHLDAAVWTVSGTRMKAQRDHRAPLSERVVEVLRAARRLGDGTGLAFPSQRGKALADRALSQLVRQQGIAAVPHGFRSSFRDWASECTNHRGRSSRRRLPTPCRTRPRVACARSKLFELRRPLMDDWMRYLNGRRRQGSFPAAVD